MNNPTTQAVTVRLDLHVLVTDPDAVITRARERAVEMWEDSPDEEDARSLAGALTALANQDILSALRLLANPAALWSPYERHVAPLAGDFPELTPRQIANFDGICDTPEMSIAVLASTYFAS